MLGNFRGNNQIRDENISDADFDLESLRQQEETNLVEGNFRSLLNTNVSENSEITAETSRAINSEISSQMSSKLEDMKSDLNSHILINSAIEEKLIPSKNAIGENSAENTNLDLRSDGPHPSNFSRMRAQRDFRSNGPHPEKFSQTAQDAPKEFPRLVAMNCNQKIIVENYVDSNQSENNEGYDSRFLHMTKSMCIAVQLRKFFFHNSQLHNKRLLEKSQNPREI